jgi:hypothetical protein
MRVSEILESIKENNPNTNKLAFKVMPVLNLCPELDIEIDKPVFDVLWEVVNAPYHDVDISSLLSFMQNQAILNNQQKILALLSEASLSYEQKKFVDRQS